MFNIIGLPFVKITEFFKRTLGLKTYQVESAFVFCALAATVVLTRNYGNGWKWVELFAVFFTFQHAIISQRLEEKQHQRFKNFGKAEVECYHKLQKYFIGKELLWMATFIYLHAWAALVGVFIFLIYYPWRKVWRKHHPL